MPSRSIRLAALAAAVALASPALAEPAPPFQELLRQSWADAPRLAEADANIAQAQGLATQAGSRPNPVVSLEVENFAGERPFNGLSGAETTASLGQQIELGGKRSARMAAGGAGVQAARARAADARAQYAFDLADAYARAEASDRRVELAQEALSLAEEDARVAAALVRAGKESDLRTVQAKAAVQSARASVDEAHAGQASAYAKLSALSGSRTPFTSVSASLLAHADLREPPVAPDPLTSPAYQAAFAEREAAARRVQVERTKSVPDVTVSLGVRRLALEGSTAMVGGVSVPLPIFDSNKGNVAAAQGELRAAEARLNAARLDAEAESRSAALRMQASASRIDAAREGEQAAAEAYRLTRIGYEAGKVPLIELLNARRALAEARGQTLDARLERLSAEAALARLAGAVPFGDRP